MADKRQPGRAVTGIGSWSIVLFKYASDHILIDVDAERFVDLLRDPRAAKPWITPPMRRALETGLR
jgi:hypothetical protein